MGLGFADVYFARWFVDGLNWWHPALLEYKASRLIQNSGPGTLPHPSSALQPERMTLAFSCFLVYLFHDHTEPQNRELQRLNLQAKL